jgi:hypothetical protein
MDAFNLILKKIIPEIGWQQHQPSPGGFYISIEPLKVAPKKKKNSKYRDAIPSILFARPCLHTISQAFEAAASSLLTPCTKRLFSWGKTKD